MDDVWSTKAWDAVKRVFPDDKNGSRIILTTRLLDIATYVCSSSYGPPHEMPFLDETQSWNLLKTKVFKQEDCPTKLERIGQIIARSCRGLPLAIAVVAGLLAVLRRGGRGVFGILEDLVKRSLVLVTKKKTNGRIKSCRLHDLVRDLCIRKAEEEKFLVHVMDSYGVSEAKSTKYQRRLCISSDMICLTSGTGLRSVTCLLKSTSLFISLKCCRLLRVLDLRFCDLGSFAAEVFELLHLKYLACRSLMNPPASLSNLQNLQTLLIVNLPKSKLRLPSEIWRMGQLRHLYSLSFDSLPVPKGTTAPLENLQTLSEVVDFECTQKMVEMIPNLKKLGVCYRNGGKGIEWSKYRLDNLVRLHQLEKFKLLVVNAPFCPQKINLTLPTTLKKLTLIRPLLPWTDMEIVGLLPNLEVLKLKNIAFFGPEWVTTEGQFPRLKFLLVDGSHLEHWISEGSDFPRLESLCLFRCSELSGIPADIGEIPTLERIEVDHWNKSLAESAKRIQEEQQSCGNDTLQVRLSPSIFRPRFLPSHRVVGHDNLRVAPTFLFSVVVFIRAGNFVSDALLLQERWIPCACFVITFISPNS
ncbi:UNVERIFIED_CONTAM: putative late blight resistance proteinR1B-16 [Sesamum radiatum]|uniref:Late blight resistance proteinR1B-16 n=1 Tax=Sesamum radiatum TaxID=300843 RepID=A0AAW2JV67_SESRA